MTIPGSVEFAPFRLRASIEESVLIAASDALEDFLRTLDGYIGRILLKKDGGDWMDLVFWRSAGDAESAMAKVAGSPACSRYFACMDGADTADAGAGVTHYGRIKLYGRTPV